MISRSRSAESMKSSSTAQAASGVSPISSVNEQHTTISLGVAMGYYRPLYNLFEPLVEVLRPIPGPAYLPILVLFLGGRSPLDFFSKIRGVMVTAFSTSSSSATLPTAIECAEDDLEIPTSVSRFVLPLSASMNHNGTALFEGVTVMFLAQAFNVELSLGDQLLVLVLCVLTASGSSLPASIMSWPRDHSEVADPCQVSPPSSSSACGRPARSRFTSVARCAKPPTLP